MFNEIVGHMIVLGSQNGTHAMATPQPHQTTEVYRARHLHLLLYATNRLRLN